MQRLLRALSHRQFQVTIKLVTCLALFVVFMPQSALSQSTLNLSQDLVGLGIASTNMVPNQPSLDAGPLLENGIGYARSHGIATVIADPGTYYFLSVHGNTHVDFADLHDMTIDFHGADLIFSHALFYGIVVYPSSNVVLQNFTVDYQPLGFTQVRVVRSTLPWRRSSIRLSPAGRIRAPSTRFRDHRDRANLQSRYTCSGMASRHSGPSGCSRSSPLLEIASRRWASTRHPPYPRFGWRTLSSFH